MYQIIKRDGKVVDFDLSKISGAIEKAFVAQNREYNSQIIDMLALNAVSDCEKKAVDGFKMPRLGGIPFQSYG